ncbi:MAG TPA: glycosyltransferase [Bryobacteraceae bacterium]|jgi:putative flippase GtrA|nr:glycosyltransferase [Bryobacteraceae bacterium]
MAFAQVPVLIPSYQPGDALETLVDALLERGFETIVVVNDGSGLEFDAIFQRAARSSRVHLVEHGVNLGKGAALKTGLNYALVKCPGCRGVVTADGDGQHHPDDIVRVAEALPGNGDALILGVRSFSGTVPLRSRLGNNLTRGLMRVMVGQRLTDTQTGLRGIPVRLIPHLLHVPSSGYEFELDMLLACKHQNIPVVQIPIRTIYLGNNESSHFHPILDSMRIYFLLLRFSMLSLCTAVVDNAVFAVAFRATGSTARSMVAGRLVAMTFNYLGVRRTVFHSQQPHSRVLPKYVALVAFNALISYSMIEFFHRTFGVPVIPAKLFSEGLLFIANFAIQRDIIFTRRGASGKATDWDRYHQRPARTARLTRRYTTKVLMETIRQAAPADSTREVAVVEIGGANSRFLDPILSAVRCRQYDVVDTNAYGLSLLAQRTHDQRVHLHEKSVLGLAMDHLADIVFSVGVVEHFDAPHTREAVLAHFDILRPGGTAIITFPTPTLLYRATRGLAELAGIWQFPDERPLLPAEVLAVVRERGEVLLSKTLWPLILTQTVVVVRKHGEAKPAQSPDREGAVTTATP